MSRHEQKIKDGVAPFLEDGEQVLAAMIAAPRGSTQKAAGSMQLGSAQRIGVKRLALGYTITLTVRGIAIKLEANAASRARVFANTVERATATRP